VYKANHLTGGLLVISITTLVHKNSSQKQATLFKLRRMDNKEFTEDDQQAMLQLLSKIKQYLTSYYEPALTVQEAEFHFSTQEIYQKLLAIYPNSAVFSAADVSTWLMEAGFICEDFGDMKFEWLLKKIKRNFR
jgi:hypothetical protein